METQNFEVVSYMASGFMRRFKVSKTNPKNFKAGDKYIVIGISTNFQIVTSERNAEKINNSILNADKIRRFLE